MFPIKYAIDSDMNTFISARARKDGTVKWVVEEMSFVMNKDTGKFEEEPMPSERTDEFLKQTRFDSAEEAYYFYRTKYPTT